jgi:ankyrin repeat protein
LHKAITGDPTTALFTAINGNDYNAAQEAIGRGADLNAHNALGETPLDLSVALNRNSITFLLLGARNETAEASGGAIGAPISLAAPSTKHQKSHAAPKATAVAVKMPPNVTGTPDPAAGFLGFGTK